jgi:lipopolysaccharide/colanic/teichoic acid biosynthesis glycosyltransferase
MLSRLLALIIILIGFYFLIVFFIIHIILIGGTPFFIQPRIGLKGKFFNLYKLRSLPINNDALTGNYLIQEENLTLWMRYLRRFHLDEIPQLFNLLKGDMVWVGPRPLLPQYLNKYTQHQALRHSVPQGIFGLSQAYGGNALPWNQRLRLDAFYAQKKSVSLDVYILLVHFKILKPTIFQIPKLKKNYADLF